MGAPDAALTARVSSASRAHPKPPSFTPAYGTAGFRATADMLPSTLFRCGLLMAARSAALGGACVGVCVTASHNPPADNGVKLVDPSGHMLAAEWEVREMGGGEGEGGGVGFWSSVRSHHAALLFPPSLSPSPTASPTPPTTPP